MVVVLNGGGTGRRRLGFVSALMVVLLAAGQVGADRNRLVVSGLAAVVQVGIVFDREALGKDGADRVAVATAASALRLASAAITTDVRS